MENETTEPAVKWGGIEPGWCPEPGENVWNSVGEKFSQSIQISSTSGSKGEDGSDGSDGSDGAQGPQGPPGEITQVDIEHLTGSIELTAGETSREFTADTLAVGINPDAIRFELNHTGAPASAIMISTIDRVTNGSGGNPIVHFDVAVPGAGTFFLTGYFTKYTITYP